MIKLKLGHEPAALTAVRKTQLPLAINAWNTVGVDDKIFKDILDSGYRIARPALYLRQHGKCAFCEKTFDQSHQPVEHFRPKKGATDIVGKKWQKMVKTHYWWLAWTWSNLYFACNDCNGTHRKGNRFPIESGSSRIAALPIPVPNPIPKAFFDVTLELNLLLDPRKDDPFKHLQWIPVDQTRPKANWNWTITGLGPRGTMTIEVLELGRREDEVNTHLLGLKQLWIQIENYLATGQQIEARNCWNGAVATYVDNPKQPFRNAARCALDSLCPKPIRNKLGWPKLPIPS